jgi:hypothetical protein
MHECPNCSQACACDQDDLWTEDNSACRCDCEWARDQGWDDSGHDPFEDAETVGCVLGERCLCPHPYHFPEECFDAETARAAQTVPGWRQRIARCLAEALAAVSRVVGGQ